MCIMLLIAKTHAQNQVHDKRKNVDCKKIVV
jgi:hypothetical protein